uniref:Uncharacterized protein n=1 Tax=Anguilla anguilla TaxID=7936 RepID=A0A0E9RPZ0_ANGAN
MHAKHINGTINTYHTGVAFQNGGLAIRIM